MNNIATIIGALGLVALIVGIAWCQPQHTIIIYGEHETMTIEEGIAPAPPQGLRILDEPYAGQQEMRYEDFEPTGEIRMRDGQGNWTEYDAEGSQEGDFWHAN